MNQFNFMARRPIEKQLCKELKDSKFRFIPIGTIHIENIYELVQRNYRTLCDNEYFCSEHCRGGNNQPEWKHGVRSVLNQLKSNTGNIRKDARRNYWEIHEE